MRPRRSLDLIASFIVALRLNVLRQSNSSLRRLRRFQPRRRGPMLRRGRGGLAVRSNALQEAPPRRGERMVLLTRQGFPQELRASG